MEKQGESTTIECKETPRLGSRTAAFSELVRDHMALPPPRLVMGASCGEAVRAMRESQTSSVLISDGQGRVCGILTERDVVRRLAYQRPGELAVEAVMSAPLHTIDEDDYLYHAIAAMRRRDLRHMPVVDRAAQVTGVLHLHKALAAASCRLMEQIERLTHEESLEGLGQVKSAQVEVAEELFEERVPAPEIQALLTQINNDIYRRVLELYQEQMEGEGWGRPPTGFCTIVMGSGGRGESFLFPDQDNGFILTDYPDQAHDRVDPYFIELASRMTRALDQVGIRLCKGHVMATNPLWRKTLSQWRMQLRHWLTTAHPNVLRLTDIFFDFEALAGDARLARALREVVTPMVRRHYGYLQALQQAQANHGVALGLFGRLAPDHTPGPHKGELNLKYHGLLPLVEAVRLLALREGIPETSTLERICGLQEAGVLSADEQDYLSGAFEVLTRLVLRQQLGDYRSGREVGAYVASDSLSSRDQDMLKDSLRAIQDLKDRVRMEFTADIF
jgi:signal-transduction protein with cAMP-binding, CBS, and nucleotidyltransferase domain